MTTDEEAKNNSDVPRCTDFACAADVYVHALAKSSVRKKQATGCFTVASCVGKNPASGVAGEGLSCWCS